MLDTNLKTQLGTYLQNIVRPIELTVSTNEFAKSAELESLANDIAALSDQVSVVFRANDAGRVPRMAVGPADEAPRVTFAGVPMGHEFTSLVLALLQAGGHPSKEAPELLEQVKSLTKPMNFEVYVSLSCHNCPDVVQAINLMAVLNPNITATMIDGGVFPQEVEEMGIMAVPTLMLNGEPLGNGRMTLEEIVNKVDDDADARKAAELSAKAIFDVLVVGGGPAGASAAIYSARKGIRTGIVAERFGGQVMDTLGIENFISVSQTEGPKLVAGLEQHVKDYDIDVMTNLRVSNVREIEVDGRKIKEIELENGAILQAKSVIVSTGARWREMNVPGEAEYKTKGVAFCPHCDGPLFKGKPVR